MDARWVKLGLGYFVLLAGIDLLAYLRLLPVRLVGFPGYDTLGHFLLIGFAGYALHRALGRRSLALLPVGFVLVALAACAEEALQTLSAARTASLGDLAADLAGLGAFAWIDRRRPA